MSPTPASLEPQEVEIPLNLGMATKPSAELQEPTHMRLVQNLHWRGLGELEKRPADDVSHTVAEPSGSAYDEADACGLIVCGDRADVVTGKHGLMGYSELTSAAQWARRTTTGDPPATLRYCPVSYELTRRIVESAQGNASNQGIQLATMAQYSGVMVLAWYVLGSSNTLKLRAVEADTGRLIAEEVISLSTGGVWARAVEYTESGKEGVLIAYTDDAVVPYVVKTVRYNHATRQFVGDSDLTTNAGSYYFTLTKNGTRVYFGFFDNTSTFLVVQDRTVGAVTTTHTGITASANWRGVCVVVGTTRTLIASATDAAVYAEVFGTPANVITVRTASSEAFTKVSAAVETRVGGTDDAVVWAVSDPSSAPTLTGTRVYAREVEFSTTTPVGGTAQFIPHTDLAGDGFTLRGMAHITLAPFLAQATYPARVSACYVARFRGNDDGNDPRHDAVAKLGHDRFLQRALGTVGSPQPAYVDSNNNAWIAFTADPSPDLINNGNQPQTIMVARLSASRPMPMPYTYPETGVTLVAGALAWEHDGVAPTEAAPLCYPIASADVSAGTGQTGVFSIIPVYRFIDRAGREKRVPGSAIVADCTGGAANRQIDVYVSKCPLRAYDAYSTEPDMEPELYITEAGGSTYYLANNASGYKSVPTSTTTDANWYKFADVQAGSTSNPAYLLDGGVVLPEPPPAFAHVARVVDRVWGVDAEDRSRVWFSKPLQAGYGVEWNATQTVTVADDCVAVIDSGGYPTVLARGGLYQIAGPGPDERGFGTFSPPQRLPYEVDCVDSASVCRTPLGVVFRGRRGLYVLSDAPRAEPGLLVDPEMLTSAELDPSISTSYRTRVVYQEQTNEIHVLTPAGDRLVYSLSDQKWSKYTTTSTTCRDIALARGKIWRLEQASGVDYLRSERLFSESGVSYNVDNVHTWEIDTPWYRMDQVAGMVRLWRVWLNLGLTADLVGVGTITLTYYVNNSETAAQSVSWTGAELSALLAYDPATSEKIARLMFVPAQQIVHTFKFVITESHTGSTAGTRPLSLRLRFGTRPSLSKRNRIPAKG